MVLEGDPTPMRVRFSYLDDDTIRDMARTYGRLRVIDGDATEAVRHEPAQGRGPGPPHRRRIRHGYEPAGRIHGSMIKWSSPIAASLSYTGCVSWTIITRILPSSEPAR